MSIVLLLDVYFLSLLRYFVRSTPVLFFARTLYHHLYGYYFPLRLFLHARSIAYYSFPHTNISRMHHITFVRLIYFSYRVEEKITSPTAAYQQTHKYIYIYILATTFSSESIPSFFSLLTLYRLSSTASTASTSLAKKISLPLLPTASCISLSKNRSS